jgi:hypothetical protein
MFGKFFQSKDKNPKAELSIAPQVSYIAAYDAMEPESRKSFASYQELMEKLLLEGDLVGASFILEKARPKFSLNSGFLSLAAKISVLKNDLDSALDIIIKKTEFAKITKDDYLFVADLIPNASSSVEEKLSSFFSLPQAKKILIELYIEKFISLGSNCEFGFVQKKFNYESMDLFRWGTISFSDMIKVFKDGGRGFLLEENCRLETLVDPITAEKKVIFSDISCNFRIPTNYRSRDNNLEADEIMFRKSINRFNFLKRKLFEDIEDAEKIFVFKPRPIDDLTNKDFLLLNDVLHEIGNVNLMILTDGAKEHPELIMHNDNFISYKISSVWSNVGEPESSILFSEWEEVVFKAYKFFSEKNKEKFPEYEYFR